MYISVQIVPIQWNYIVPWRISLFVKLCCQLHSCFFVYFLLVTISNYIVFFVSILLLCLLSILVCFEDTLIPPVEHNCSFHCVVLPIYVATLFTQYKKQFPLNPPLLLVCCHLVRCMFVKHIQWHVEGVQKTQQVMSLGRLLWV